MFSTKYTILLVIAVYFLSLYLRQPQIFTNRFDSNLIDQYFLCQDIPNEVPGKRVFISDGEIHQAAGYLYWQGYDPTEINFQHPPLIKYLFGLSIELFSNPFIPQIIFGVALIYLTYIYGSRVFQSHQIGFMASLLLAVDPLLSSLSADALLDLGQAVFILAYILVSINQKSSYFWQGVFLGLVAASKFWAGALFFLVLTFVYKLVAKKEFNKNFIKKILNKKLLKQTVNHFSLQLLVAFIIFCITYLPSFVYRRGAFNIIFFELKTLKYWFNHSISSVPFASLILFTTGYFRTWWDNTIVKTPAWTILWPISFFISLFTAGKYLLNKQKVNRQIFLNLLPVLYLVYLGVQAPFERYFIIVLPFLYLQLAKSIILLLSSLFRRYYGS